MHVRFTGVLYWALCTVLVCGVGFAEAAPSVETVPHVEITMMRDGSVELEGVRFTEAEGLKAKLIEIQARTPSPDYRLRSQDGAEMKALGMAIVLLKKAGVVRVGFITEPN